MSLTTHLRRSLFALPLLIVAAAGVAHPDRPAAPTLEAWAPSGDDCAAPSQPLGARGLVRMPGDLTPFTRRLRCAG